MKYAEYNAKRKSLVDDRTREDRNEIDNLKKQKLLVTEINEINELNKQIYKLECKVIRDTLDESLKFYKTNKLYSNI